MSEGRLRIHGVIQRAEDMPGVWLAWCPDLDLVTQGDHADHAVAMLEDAIRGVVPDWLAAWYFSSSNDFMEPIRKKVLHPLRAGAHREEDDLYPVYRACVDGTGEWACSLDVNLGQLDHEIPVKVAVTWGSLWWSVRSGIVSADVSFADKATVPAVRFDALAFLKSERPVHEKIPVALLDARPAGMSREGFADAYITERLRGWSPDEAVYQWSVTEAK